MYYLSLALAEGSLWSLTLGLPDGSSMTPLLGPGMEVWETGFSFFFFGGGGVRGPEPEVGYSWTLKEEGTPSTNVFHYKNTGEASQDGEEIH